MKKILLLFVVGLFALTACSEGETTTATNDGATQQDEQKEETNNNIKEINQVIVDDENIKATLKNIVFEEDEIWGKSYKVNFEVENKSEKTLEVQANEVSADNKMVDETLLTMSDTVSSGKMATCTLDIDEIEGYEFPTMEQNFEMILHVFDYDEFVDVGDYEVNVNLAK